MENSECDDNLERVLKSGRRLGAVGRNSTCHTHLIEELRAGRRDGGDVILDYGAGKFARGVCRLQVHGFKHVDAYEHPGNYDPAFHRTESELRRAYDVVILSNVINVQPSRSHLQELLGKVLSRVAVHGALIFNFPRAPWFTSRSAIEAECRRLLTSWCWAKGKKGVWVVDRSISRMRNNRTGEV